MCIETGYIDKVSSEKIVLRTRLRWLAFLSCEKRQTGVSRSCSLFVYRRNGVEGIIIKVLLATTHFPETRGNNFQEESKKDHDTYNHVSKYKMW